MTLWAILGASLVGSLHCAAMCGGFAAMCGGVGGAGGTGRGTGSGRLESLSYALGRGVAYTSLGAIAGGIGAGIDLAGLELAGLQASAALVLGAMLIVLGLWSLRGRETVSAPLITLGAIGSARPSFLNRGRLHLARLLHRRGPTAALGVGLLSALLPCAWLWSFLAVAASTGDAVHGGLSMLVFWLGTVPALAGVGLLAGKVGRRVGRHAPRIVALVMIALGVAALVGRASLPGAGSTEAPPCHVDAGGE